MMQPRDGETWYELSLRIIDRELAMCEAGGITGQELAYRVSKAYRFGPRANWPYQAWLRAVRARLAPLGLATPLPEPVQGQRTTPLGQLELLPAAASPPTEEGVRT